MTIRSFVCSSLCAGSIAAGSIALMPPLAAQPASDFFGQTVDVRVVNVDVFATDKRGRPVTDLTQDDFLLLMDGQPVEIAYFYAVGSEEAKQTGASVLKVLEASTPGETPSPPSSPSPASELLIVIYLDNYWLTQADRRRVLDDIEQFVVRQDGSPVSFLVASHDPGIRVHTPVTRDQQVVASALAALPEQPTQGLAATRDRIRVFDGIRGVWESYFGSPRCANPCDCAWEQMIGNWEAYAQNLGHRVSVAGSGMKELLASLAGLPERKAVLYVGSGLEQRPGLDILTYLQELCPDREREAATFLMRYDSSDTLLDLAAHANSARATIYSLDAGGIRADGASSVDSADTRLRPSAQVSRIHRSNLQASMQIIAGATGGRSILNANQPLEDLLELESDFEHGYALGFEPAGAADGRTHKLRVELREGRKGVNLRYRQSYVDKQLDKRLIDRAIAAMTFGAGDNPLGVEAGLGELQTLASTGQSNSKGKGKGKGKTKPVKVPVEIAVEVARLTLIPSPDGEPGGRFRVFLAARAANGDRTLLREKFFDVTPQAIAAGRQKITVNLNLEPGDYTIGIGVRDEVGTATSYLALPATVTAPIETAAVSSP